MNDGRRQSPDRQITGAKTWYPLTTQEHSARTTIMCYRCFARQCEILGVNRSTGKLPRLFPEPRMPRQQQCPYDGQNGTRLNLRELRSTKSSCAFEENCPIGSELGASAPSVVDIAHSQLIVQIRPLRHSCTFAAAPAASLAGEHQHSVSGSSLVPAMGCTKRARIKHVDAKRQRFGLSHS